MKKVAIIFTFIFSSYGFSQFILQSVNVGGEKEALVNFTGTGTFPIPSQTIQEGVIELTFQGGEISDVSQGRLDLDAPHVLIRRVSVYSPDKGVVKAKIVVNGTTDSIKDRFTFTRTEKGIAANIAYPKAESAVLNLLKEEQQPVKDLKKVPKIETARVPYLQFALIIGILMAAGASTVFLVRFLKKKGMITGSRKYLIEQLASISVGNKSTVNLLKIGKEFVLVGVTPSQVSHLSNLPRLQEQYEDETSFERGAFREAVQEEVDRIQVANA